MPPAVSPRPWIDPPPQRPAPELRAEAEARQGEASLVPDQQQQREHDQGSPQRRHRHRPVAAIDVGTNNCRLLVAVPSRKGFLVIDAFSRIVRLGEGVSRTGELSAAAMERTLEALRICASKIRAKNAGALRAVATEACRRSANFPGFRDRVAELTGIELELISPAEEARLSFMGCSPLIEPDSRYVVAFDIGGGSTEVTFARRSRRQNLVIQDIISLPIGVVTLAETYGGDVITPTTYEAMAAEVTNALAAFHETNHVDPARSDGKLQLLGASGTVTTLSAIHMGLPSYNRAKVDGTSLSVDAARSVSEQLRAQDRKARCAQPCIGPERADVVVAGCAILEAMLRLWPTRSLSVADRGVREGILLDLIGKQTRVTFDQGLSIPAAHEPS